MFQDRSDANGNRSAIWQDKIFIEPSGGKLRYLSSIGFQEGSLLEGWLPSDESSLYQQHQKSVAASSGYNTLLQVLHLELEQRPLLQTMVSVLLGCKFWADGGVIPMYGALRLQGKSRLTFQDLTLGIL